MKWHRANINQNKAEPLTVTLIFFSFSLFLLKREDGGEDVGLAGEKLLYNLNNCQFELSGPLQLYKHCSARAATPPFIEPPSECVDKGHCAKKSRRAARNRTISFIMEPQRLHKSRPKTLSLPSAMS